MLLSLAVVGERPGNQRAGAAVQVAWRSLRRRSGGSGPRAALGPALPEVAITREGEETLRAREVAAAEGRTRRWPRGWAAQPGWEASTTGPPRDALPAPSLRTPPPSLRRARSAAAPVRSDRIRPSQAGPDSHPGPWASAFPLAWEKHRALPSSRGATRAGRTSREGRPPAATSRPGPGAPRSGARGRRSLRLPPGRAGAGGGRSGCSLEGLRLPRPKLPAALGNFIRLQPPGASSPIR